MPKPLNNLGKDLATMQANIKAAITKSVRESAAIIETHYKGSFRIGGFADSAEKWRGRKNGKENKQQSTRAILVKSGDLRRSLRATVTGPTTIRLSTDVPYAKIHNEGSLVSATATVRAHVRKTKKGNANVKSHKRDINFTMPKRQFMPTPNETIGKALEQKLYANAKANLESTLPK